MRVGLIGFGGMGHKHLACYQQLHGAEVVAVADVVKERLEPGESAQQTNIGADQAVIDPGRHRLYEDAYDLIADDEVDMVDICLPTFLHAEYSIAALKAGKHVLCEKPMALGSQQCERMLQAANEAPGMLMIAHVVRFFPAYEYLSETVESGRFGRLLQLSMWRSSSPPRWSWADWLLDAGRSGGGMLDLHIHDADFVQYLLGPPRAVCSTGARGESGGWDVVETEYIYDDAMAVAASGNLAMPEGWEFEAGFVAAFDSGALSCGPRGLLEVTHEGTQHPHLPEKDGYEEEIAYFVDCIEKNELPAVCTPQSSALSVRLVEAERESLESRAIVKVR